VATFYYKDLNAPRPNRPRRVAVLALIEDKRRLLLERRADAPLWGLIGGGVNDDETLVDALRREVEEESGLRIGSYALFGTFSDPSRVVEYADGNIFQPVTLVYAVAVEDLSSLRPSPESIDLRFFRHEDLPLEELVPTHQPIIERYLSGAIPPFLD
jgi:8-oxo-dGTP pyrophosphatase MutT (NUDIX family)